MLPTAQMLHPSTVMSSYSHSYSSATVPVLPKDEPVLPGQILPAKSDEIYNVTDQEKATAVRKQMLFQYSWNAIQLALSSGRTHELEALLDAAASGDGGQQSGIMGPVPFQGHVQVNMPNFE
ncbi:hypothetical protein J8273_1313 [Carpediemonas membranifera]|uniref:Uncharacterized protein n=1 Tax=Carpediemonas membranifera TaxID=201153 RepID=A0A8J6B0Z5_9EUKA|nr:hypothetical protein J8273_1313 [Carpediemonas membranifera]|eukprot:KAG9396965.1 hypothetical protein J8273_1313 [Carpediemonas membranifera]